MNAAEKNFVNRVVRSNLSQTRKNYYLKHTLTPTGKSLTFNALRNTFNEEVSRVKQKRYASPPTSPFKRMRIKK